MANDELIESPRTSKNPPDELSVVENGEKSEALFSPRFRSVAAMAGWDEEAILIASLIVEDTPDRHLKQKKRPDLPNFKTPPTNSRKKRRAQRRSPTSMPVDVLDLDDDIPAKEENGKNDIESKIVEKKGGENESDAQDSADSSSSSAIPCIDRLREELSCAICLEICFEPSTTPCGHSFCKKCLRSAADKCGKRCPKCRQLISNGRSCTVNTILWNTIQLLFPKEVEARKAAGALNSREAQRPSPTRASTSNPRNRILESLNSPESDRRRPNGRNHHSMRRRILRPSGMSNRGDDVVRRRNELSSQDEDAALALRLQREELKVAVRGGPVEPYANSFALARANLRAMASRATNIRVRGRRT